ncbi:RagB/SusD family nutrient uptake outer membrane protein [Mucilaginibacter ginkgonis]|uniref:RagB/SusD family nutrient uptake outer membrane protein n=1 Tax=Mucilaginibacter ginkgonis TaxID=2682091 RepID=A0A6I4IMH8_9SPHI|nr:RagB/SusD family nutrient uptake outer membrane protein [Mucilaginibacter ginkgonis]QQL50300.1 RagB/SusD family nutrient uptake outer membrane protein [Mucilaginibacter ginkgonis]
MKKNIIYTLTGAAILLCASLTACKKILDIQPQSQIIESVYFKNEGDFDPFVIGNYTNIRILANNITFGTERSEELINGINARLTTAWSQVLTVSTGSINYNVSTLPIYKAIGSANLLLAKIEPFAFPNTATKNRLKAESLCQRAYCYFYLAHIIGDAPILLDPITDDNVPQLPRSKAADVMKQVFADLDAAIALFPDKTYPNKYRFSYGAAQAMKAEAKLWSAKVTGGGAADFNDALTAAQAVETTGVSLLPAFANVTTTRANAEVIMSAYFNRDESGATSNYALNALPFLPSISGATNLDSIPYTLTSTNGQSAYQISPLSRSLWSGLTGDKRIPATFIIERQGTTQKNAWITKLPGNKYTDDRISDNDVIMYRLADVYLMEAEAYAGINNTAQAINYINKVRTRAGIANYAGATDKATVERAVFDERGREMFFENKRWYDVVRFHYGGTINAYNYVPNLKGKTTPLFWPLSPTVLAANSALTQTTGY